MSDENDLQRDILIRQTAFLVKSNKQILDNLQKFNAAVSILNSRIDSFWEEFNCKIELCIYKAVEDFLSEYVLNIKIQRKEKNNDY